MGKSRNVFIFSFIFICSYISTVHGDPFLCIQEDPDYLFYVKYCAVDLARSLHLIFGLQPIPACILLATAQTEYFDAAGNSWSMGRTNDGDSFVADSLMYLETMAIQTFSHFCLDEVLLAQRTTLSDDGKRAMLGSIRTASERLLRTRHYKITDPLLNSINKLKWVYLRYNGGLYIDGIKQEVPPVDTQFLSTNLFLRIALRMFLQRGYKEMNHQYSLYVSRNELAVTLQHNPNELYVGSDSLTRSIVVILKHRTTHAMGVAHISNISTAQVAVDNLVNQMNYQYTEDEDTFLLYIIGGYMDTEDLLFAIMEAFYMREERINLMLVCAGVLNPLIDNTATPRIEGAAISTSNLTVYPAYFRYQGPNLPIRLARIMVGKTDVINIYDHTTDQVSIEFFQYTEDQVNEIVEIKEHPTKLQQKFPGMIIDPNALNFLETHPTSDHAFPNNQAFRYKRNENKFWIPV